MKPILLSLFATLIFSQMQAHLAIADENVDQEKSLIENQISKVSQWGRNFTGNLGSPNGSVDCTVEISDDNQHVLITTSDDEAAEFDSDIYTMSASHLPSAKDSHLDFESTKSSISNGLPEDSSTKESLVVRFNSDGVPSSVYVFNGPPNWNQISPGISLNCVLAN
jgi:hypothetical protein